MAVREERGYKNGLEIVMGGVNRRHPKGITRLDLNVE